ncbi:adenylate/guanylate cyclase domain-containing protein [Marinospirillum perlucidum]|uniref:adenylate/guanylate cyclase domain-containing protein n=1 Tax=Marinospirillum perlucidum TaxID=1982602 RepID=UPI000DF3BAD6|nr:adenylate/guanylate cyclase domain-containing protein [Marinospirillum perlucidum]
MSASIKAFLDELLFYSGQFALFYIVMRLSASGPIFLLDTGHLLLVITLLIQSGWLAAQGQKPWVRIVGSFLVPVVYSLSEIGEGLDYFFNAAHMGFWIYAAVSAALQLQLIRRKKQGRKQHLSELLLVGVTISIFLFLYFYFDIAKEGLPEEELTLVGIFAHLPGFLQDPTHLYIIFGGLVLALVLGLGRMEVTRLKDRLNTLFGVYVDTSIRDRILSGKAVESETAELCILFADLRNFTSLSENHNAEAITRMLNRYFEFWDQAVRREGGVIDKFIGDAVMVIFGLRQQEHPCEAAVSCVHQLLEDWPRFQNSLAEEGLPVPEVFGAGCHFGRVIIGNVGSRARRSYTVIGDDVNQAARLESACKSQQQQMIISDRVYQQLPRHKQEPFTSLGWLEVKGKARSIQAWGVRAEHH